jgi:hypothetical protein
MDAVPIQLISSSQPSSPGTNSSDVEILALQEDEDEAPFADAEVTIIGDDDILQDPMSNFPYNEVGRETNLDTVQRLIGYFSTRKQPRRGVIC